MKEIREDSLFQLTGGETRWDGPSGFSREISELIDLLIEIQLIDGGVALLQPDRENKIQ